VIDPLTEEELQEDFSDIEEPEDERPESDEAPTDL
jgi:hypothetical protein